MSNNFEHDCLFRFCMSEKVNTDTVFKKSFSFGKYIVSLSEKTSYELYSDGKSNVAVIGIAVNVLTGNYREIAKELCEASGGNISELIKSEKSLGGKYIIMFGNGDNYYIFGDATGTIPLSYSFIGNRFYCSTNISDIIKKYSLSPDPALSEISSGANIGSAMPFDITSYKEIKQLLPNHYIDITLKRPVRYIYGGKSEPLSSCEASEITHKMIENILMAYSEMFDILCPLTGGRDSRVVFAFLKHSEVPFAAYTDIHSALDRSCPDLTIPPKICTQMGIDYSQHRDTPLPEGYIDSFTEYEGVVPYSEETTLYAYNTKLLCGSKAILTGDIIGQVGKCSLHRDIPEKYATSEYFLWKIHNYNKKTKVYLQHWLDEIEKSDENLLSFDLFSVENRLGRWAAQENHVYNSVGQVYLNIFNSRAIIEAWSRVSRKERINSEIHTKLIKIEAPELLDIPYGSDGFTESLARKNHFIYYLASGLKYHINKFRFNHGIKTI